MSQLQEKHISGWRDEANISLLREWSLPRHEVIACPQETQGNRVTLYQDAHVPDDTFIPDVAVDGGVWPGEWGNSLFLPGNSHFL